MVNMKLHGSDAQVVPGLEFRVMKFHVHYTSKKRTYPRLLGINIPKLLSNKIQVP